jgi:hypothetical protein
MVLNTDILTLVLIITFKSPIKGLSLAEIFVKTKFSFNTIIYIYVKAI